jgi:hypothetical protein
MPRFLRFLAMIVPLALGGLAFGPSCRHAAPLGPVSEDPLGRFRQAPRAWAWKAETTFHIQARQLGVAGTTGGTLVIHRPSDLFVQVQGPMGGVLLELAMNARTVGVRLPSKGLALRGNDPEALVRGLSGQAFGVDGLLAILTGHLPASGFEIDGVERKPEGIEARVRLHGDASVVGPLSLKIRTDPQGRDLEEIVLDRDAPASASTTGSGSGAGRTTLLRLRYKGFARVGPDRLPLEVDLDLPELPIQADLRFRGWEQLGEIPDIFGASNQGTTVDADLLEALKGWLQGRKDEHP